MVQAISILGSTGSIGTQSLDVVDKMGNVKVLGLSTNTRIDLLEQQIRKYKPLLVAVMDGHKAAELKQNIKDLDTKVVTGIDGLTEVATLTDVQMVVTSVVGIVGLVPTLAAIEAGKHIALANKETLVTAGELVMQAALKKGVRILPVDSEHSAIFQCLQGNDNEKQVNKLIITASGGPFRGKKRAALLDITPAQALKHPKWDMGSKISIDSATLMNKGLEVIEAKWLFGMDLDRIQVVVHPESIIHSMVEFVDCSILAQLGLPDMRLPIQYALTYPKRIPSPCEPMDFVKHNALHFEQPDLD
ncbi:MAG: 1-deoxy-D-xylulose-5-phosphate reductoisomerase, partial [Hyphomonadaceae bacterium]|nr:1-deoxy-D-xylulose-5-phosphate reductoisomerase [Clostridia bacterium]